MTKQLTSLINSVVIISVIRLHSVAHVDMLDVTYTVIMPIVWSALEPCLAITLACVPLFRPLRGGEYSPTGTAKFGTTTKKPRAVTQKRSRHFNKLKNQPSITQCANEVPQRGLRSISPAAMSRRGTADGNMDTKIELKSIPARSTWVLEEQEAHAGMILQKTMGV